jgi:hypothetical protein
MNSFEDFYQQFQSEIRDKATGEVSDDNLAGTMPDFRENVFTELMIEYLNENGILEDATRCHLSSKTTKGHIKINAWSIEPDEGTVTLCVSQYNCSEKPVRLPKADAENLLNQAVRAFEMAVEGYCDKMEPSTEEYGMMKAFYDSRADLATLKCVLLTDGILPSEPMVKKSRQGAYSIKYDCWDLPRLHKIVESGLPYESVKIDLSERFGLTLSCLPPFKKAEDHTVYLTVIPGSILCELYEEFGARLLDLNVRSFLQARGKVNSRIRETICKEPLRFLAYNNGISATAESIEITHDPEAGDRIKSLVGFQIVNGGQTMASIHRAANFDKADISNVYVQAKITVVPAEKIEELAPLISRYANSQNRVSDADFSSNDPFNIELQHLSEKNWAPGEQSRWFYERTRGQYQVEKFRQGLSKAKQFDKKCPTSQKFTKTDMAKYLNCWLQLPHIVSLGAQKNFIYFMDNLHESTAKDWKPDEKYFKELVAMAILFRGADKIAREIDIQAYKANVVAYTISLLSQRCLDRLNLMEIWDSQKVPENVTETYRLWMQEISGIITKSAETRNVTEWCKKKECWHAVLESGPQLPPGLRQELESLQPLPTVGHVPQSISSQDRTNLAMTMKIDAATWFKISEWGRKKKKLKDWQCGIAHTLSGYASQGWQRVPSPKQAKQAVQILKIAEEEGLFNKI